ncbi:hypothetical protein RIEGSTA812A_PEG_1194 [invertebrate metagenome]|uniref:C2H2-type domain-containing protein n=1 Tax=invertebrate metagenome TaxID=1711999 RepID=A0A484H803_9ZZZZ
MNVGDDSNKKFLKTTCYPSHSCRWETVHRLSLWLHLRVHITEASI